MLALGIYIGIGLLCAIFDVYLYWGSTGYSTSYKIWSALFTLLWWPFIVVALLCFWIVDLVVSYRKKKANRISK